MLAISMFSCSSTQEKSEIVVAVSSNLQYAIKEIVEQFENETGLTCQLVIGSSGKLTAQIMEGAPYHIFISADMKYPGELYENGKTLQPPYLYAFGKLVLWTMNNKLNLSFEELEEDKVVHIAIPNPEIAPYGRAALEALTNQGLINHVEKKLVYGESISQVNQYITSQAAEVGITSMSSVLSNELKGKGKWIELDSLSYTPIAQGLVVIEQDFGNQNNLFTFYEFLTSESSKGILRSFGYSVP